MLVIAAGAGGFARWRPGALFREAHDLDELVLERTRNLEPQGQSPCISSVRRAAYSPDVAAAGSFPTAS